MASNDELELIMAITNSYVEDTKFHEPNLTKEQLYEKCRKEATDDLFAYILAEVLQTQVNIWANFKHEMTKRDLSSDVMPKGARKMTDQELLAGVISQEQAKATARFGGES